MKLGEAYGLLKRVLALATEGGAQRTLPKLRRAIKSLGGAHRHAVGMHVRQEVA